LNAVDYKLLGYHLLKTCFGQLDTQRLEGVPAAKIFFFLFKLNNSKKGGFPFGREIGCLPTYDLFPHQQGRA
jgi:hypothetical protein